MTTPDPHPARPGWTTIARTVIHRGRVVLVDHDVRLADGTDTHYEVDESVPFAVATLVIDGDDLLLAKQYRYPIDRWIIDLPGGAGVEGETPEQAARRELEEELGLIADEFVPLHTFYVNPGRTAWPVHVFACTSAAAGGLVDDSDPSEQVHLARLGVDEVDRLIASGEIVDPTLIVARAAAAAKGLLPPLG